MTTLEENNGVNVMEDENLAPKEAQRLKKKPVKERKSTLKEKLVKPEVAAKTKDEMKKSVEMSEKGNVMKVERGKWKKDGVTMKEDNQVTEEATTFAVASQVSEVSTTVAVETKGKEESPVPKVVANASQPTTEDEQEEASGTRVPAKKGRGKKLKDPVNQKVPAVDVSGVSQTKAAEVKKGRGNASQPTTEDEQEEASGTRVPAMKGRGKKPKEPVKEKAPAVDVSGVSQPLAAEVKIVRGKARVIALEEVEQKVPAAEEAQEKVNPNTLQETEPALEVHQEVHGKSIEFSINWNCI